MDNADSTDILSGYVADSKQMEFSSRSVSPVHHDVPIEGIESGGHSKSHPAHRQGASICITLSTE